MTSTSRKRQGVPDIIKGIAVLLMIQVHLMELFSTPAISSSMVGKISLFLGGPLAAPAFMLIMGYYCSFKKGIASVIIRGIKLIGLGIILNLMLNTHVLIAIYNNKFNLNPWEYVWGVDILFLAGLSLIFIALLHMVFKSKWGLYLISALAIIIISPTIQDIFISEGKVKYLLAYFGGKYSWSYFAFFPWVVYPVVGYGFKLLYQKYGNFRPDKKIEWGIIGILSILMLASIKWAVGISSNLDQYYHHEWLFFLWVIACIAYFTLIIKRLDLKWGNLFIIDFIKWIGINVTAFYFVQWIIIGNIATAIYKTQNLGQVVLWYFGIVATCILLIRFVLNKPIQRHYPARSGHNTRSQ